MTKCVDCGEVFKGDRHHCKGPSQLHPLVQLRRMTTKFERLAGKTVSRVGYGGQFMWMVFSDGTYIFLDGHNWSMQYDSSIDGQWKVDIGLMSQAALDAENRKHRERFDARREAAERERRWRNSRLSTNQ